MVLLDKKEHDLHKIPHNAKVLFGGFSGMLVTTFVHPLDLLKVRMQVHPSAKNTIQIAQLIFRCEGISAFYAGLNAGLMRQATHTTTRLGVYYWLYDEYRKKYGTIPSLSEKMMIGAVAGMAGAFAGNPSEVVLVRMMAEVKYNPCGHHCGSPRQYRGLVEALYRITTTEGFRTLWRGGTLTLTRSLLVTFAQIGTYTQAREVLLERKLAEGSTLHIYTSIISSFFTACMTLPVDLVKTRYQYRKGKWKSMSQREVFSDIIQTKGVVYFWKGFLPYFIRLSLHTTLTYLVLEEVNEFYITYKK